MKRNNKTLNLIMLIMIATGMTSKLSSQYAGDPPMGSVYGYVLLHNGDTLKGLVKWRVKYVENNLSEITFTAKNGNSKIFKASEISGFGHYTGGKVKSFYAPESPENENYESVTSLKKGIPVFMYRFLDGRIKVFYHRIIQFISSDKEPLKIDGISFSFNTDDGLSIGSSYYTSYKIIESRSCYSNYLIKKDKGDLMEINKKNYDTLLPVLFGDCPAIKQETEKNPELARFRNFMILAEVYNHICNESPDSH